MGDTWSFACPDWADRLASGKSLVPDLPLFKAKADKAVAIFNKLRVPDIEGQPSFGEAAGDWFRDIVRVIAGSLDDEGVRNVPEVFALIGKKNSKTTNGAGLMLTALLANTVPRGEFLFIGPTQEIADLAFQQAAGMIDADPDGYLQKRFHVIEHRKTIRDRVTKAFVKVKTFSMKVMTGSKPIGVLIDELHIMGSIHYASRVLGQIRGALESKKNSFLLMISTQSDEVPAGVFKQELTYARAVRDGKITNSRMLPILYEFPKEMQADKAKPWADPRLWPMVMPNLGRSLHLDTMIAGYTAAVEKGAEEERRWASQHLNVQIGMAAHEDNWAGAALWSGAVDPTITSFEAFLDLCEVVTVGGDGGGLDDLFGGAFIGRRKVTREWLLWAHAWCQPVVLERRKDIASTLEDLRKAGDLTICEYPTQDVEEFANMIEQVKDMGLLPDVAGIGVDPVGISALVDELASRGIHTLENGGPVLGIAQGYRLSPAIWGLERKLNDGTFQHGGQPLMTWCVGNAKSEMRGNAVLITKQVAGKAKIDPFIATLNAAMLMNRNPEAAGISVYETRGLAEVEIEEI